MRFLDRHADSDGQRTILECIENAASDTSEDRKHLIRKKILEVMGATGVSFNFWSHPTLRALLEVWLNKLPYKNHLIDKITLSRPTLTRFSGSEAQRIREQLKATLPRLAKEGLLSLAFDHKHVRTSTDSRWKILGIEASWLAGGKMNHVMFDYVPMTSSGETETSAQIERILADYDLLSLVRNRSVCFVGDQASEKTMKQFANIYSICNSHSLSCLLKRSCEHNLSPHDPDGYDKWSVMIDFIDKCESTRTDERASNLPAAACFPSLNAFFVSKKVENEHNIERFYRSEQEGKWTETSIAAEDMDKIIEEKKANFLKLDGKGKRIEKCSGSVRFRKTIYAVERLLHNKELLETLCEFNHPQRRLIDGKVIPDMTFAEAISPFLSRIHRSLNFLESDQTSGISYFLELEDLLCFAIDRVSNRKTDENRFARSLIISILEQVCKKRIDQRGNKMRTCMVPKRFTEKDMAAVYLNPETTLCTWNRAFDKLDATEDNFLLKAKVT